MCVCVFENGKENQSGRGMGWGSSLHQMRLCTGTLLSQSGTHLPMVSCEVLGERRNKGAKRLRDNDAAPRRAFKSGTQAAQDKLCQSLCNYCYLCVSVCVLSRGLVWVFMERSKDTCCCVSLSFPCNVELNQSSSRQ